MIKDAKVIGVWGRRGCGKSTLCKNLIKQDKRLIVFDVLHEYSGKNWLVIPNISTVAGQKKLVSFIKASTFKIAVQTDRKNDYLDELNKLIDLLFKIQQPYKDNKHNKKIRLVIEEMSLCVPNVNNPKVREIVQAVNIGRHYGLDIIGLSQRPAQVHSDFKGQTAIDYFFSLADAVDKDRIAKKVGKEWADKIGTLENHCFIRYDNGNMELGKNKLK